jgi:hypothetical protein
MGLLEEAADLNNLKTVQVLALNSTSRRWEPSGRVFAAQVRELGGREAQDLGRSADTEMRALFTNLNPDGSKALTNKERVAFGENDGRGWSVVSVEGIYNPDAPGAIANIERAT